MHYDRRINKSFLQYALLLNIVLLMLGGIAFAVFVFQTKAFLKDESERDTLKLAEKIEVIFQKSDLICKAARNDLDPINKFNPAATAVTLRSYQEVLQGFLGQTEPYLRCVSEKGDVINTNGYLAEKLTDTQADFPSPFLVDRVGTFMNEKGIHFSAAFKNKKEGLNWAVLLSIKLEPYVNLANRSFVKVTLSNTKNFRSKEEQTEIFLARKIPTYPYAIQVSLDKQLWKGFLWNKVFLFFLITEIVFLAVLIWGRFYYKKLNFDFFRDFQLLKELEKSHHAHIRNLDMEKQAIVRSYKQSAKISADTAGAWVQAGEHLLKGVQLLFGKGDGADVVLSETQSEMLKGKIYQDLHFLSLGLTSNRSIEAIKLEDLVKDAQGLFLYHSYEKEAVLTIRSAGLLPEIQTDVAALKQTIASIFYHALMGVPKGGYVEALVEQGGEGAAYGKVTFTDDGFIIDHSVIQKMKGGGNYLPFFLLEWEKIETLVSYLKGSLEFVDTANQGRKVILSIPLAWEEEPQSKWRGNVYRLY